MMVSKKQRDTNLDLVKVFATIFVIKLHSGTGGLSSDIIHYICGAAIPLFIMTTGALILSRDKYDFKYVLHRVLGILKILVLWSILFSVGKMVVSKNIENPLKYAIQSFNQRGILSHFWYLWMLLFLYILIFALEKLRIVIKKNRGGGITLSCFSLCYHFA